MKFKDLKILMFSAAFFGYDHKVKKKLEAMGANVTLYDERSITSSLEKALLKFVPFIFRHKTYKYYKQITESNKINNFDIIFFNECTMVSAKELKLLHTYFPNSRYILYLEDSIKTLGNRVLFLFEFFDKVLTYDRIDYETYKLIYKNLYFRPLYFSDEYSCKNKKIKSSEFMYDISFIGTIHSDRYKIIKKIEDISTKENFAFFSYNYLQSWFVYYFYIFFKKEFRLSKFDDFEYKKIDGYQISDIFEKSKAVLDMQYPYNCGLTMRTIETLGMHRKLITTNSDIRFYDFYNESNILIIDRDSLENLTIPVSFILDDYVEIDPAIIEKYSLEEWLKEVFR